MICLKQFLVCVFFFFPVMVVLSVDPHSLQPFHMLLLMLLRLSFSLCVCHQTRTLVELLPQWSQRNHISSTYDIYSAVEEQVPTCFQNFSTDLVVRYQFL